MLALTERDARRLRMHAQRLSTALGRTSEADSVAGRPTRPAKAASAVVGLQAQRFSAAVDAIRPRSSALTAEDVRTATIRGDIVRTWCIRGTLHLLSAQDVGWLLELLGEGLIEASARRFNELGLDPKTLEAGERAIADLLADEGPLTRAELLERIRGRGIMIAPKGQAIIHLIRYAALHGIVCYGPDRDGLETFRRLESAAQEGLRLARTDRDAATAELARRYLAAFAPATPADFAKWSRLPIRAARSAWTRVGGELSEVTVGDQRAWMLSRDADSAREIAETPSGIRLLPAFDTYLLGYRSRAQIVEAAFASRVWPGGGIIHPVIVDDGRVIGTWKYAKRHREIVARPFKRLSAKQVSGIRDEATDIARFLGHDVELAVGETG